MSCQVGGVVVFREGDDPVDHVLGQRSDLSRGSKAGLLSRSRHRQVRAAREFFLDGAEVVGREPDQQIRTRCGEDMSELDRPEATVGDDQVARADGAGQRVGEATLAVAVAAKAGVENSVRSDLHENHRPDLGNPKGTPPVVERPSKVSPLLVESGRSNRVPSRARSRRPRHHTPGVSAVASGPAICRSTVPNTSFPGRARARHNDDRFTRAMAQLPGMPLVSARNTSSYGSWTNRHRPRTRYTTSRVGRKSAAPLGPVVLGYRRVHQLGAEHLRQDPDPHLLARNPPRHTRGNDPPGARATALASSGGRLHRNGPVPGHRFGQPAQWTGAGRAVGDTPDLPAVLPEILGEQPELTLTQPRT